MILYLCVQVVTLAVYVYFLTALIGDQTLIDRSGEAMTHVWFPVFTRDGTAVTVQESRERHLSSRVRKWAAGGMRISRKC
jgi:hypothetical protein